MSHVSSVNISGKPNGHGSLIRTVEEPEYNPYAGPMHDPMSILNRDPLSIKLTVAYCNCAMLENQPY